MKKSLLATVALAGLALAPSSAFANYYSYDRCVKNGGGYFGCLGELADVMIAAPEIEKQFGFLEGQKEQAVVGAIKSLSNSCDEKEKGESRLKCYRDGLGKEFANK